MNSQPKNARIAVHLHTLISLTLTQDERAALVDLANMAADAGPMITATNYHGLGIAYALELLDATVDSEAITDDGERTCLALAAKIRAAAEADTGRMSFAKFKRSAVVTDNLPGLNCDWEDHFEGAGISYANYQLCIELVKRGPCSSADQYSAQLFGDDYFGTREDCEAELWAAATSEGCFADRPVRFRDNAAQAAAAKARRLLGGA